MSKNFKTYQLAKELYQQIRTIKFEAPTPDARFLFSVSFFALMAKN